MGGSYMKQVNPWFLDDLMSPISGLADDDDAVMYYRQMNVDSEEKFRAIIREKFVVYYYALDEQKQEKAKLALSFYLSKPEFNFESVFDACLPPFDPPKDARDFFVWLWEELFPGENYVISDLKSYKIVPDIYEPNRPTKKRS